MAMPPKPQDAPVMDESAQAPPPAAGDQQQTAELPATLFGGQMPKEGDAVTLKVVAVDAQAGSVTVTKAAEEAPEESGTEGMAGAFDRAKMSKQGEM